MNPSTTSPHSGSRSSAIKYAHSPYVYRTTVEDAPVSPMSDGGRPDSSSVPAYHSPRSLSHSAGHGEGSGLLMDAASQPGSSLGHVTTGAEYSQPIHVGSAPNVHARFRRGVQSPMSRAGNDSGNRSGFPTSPSNSLPPRSPFLTRDEMNNSNSGFVGGESAPVRVANNPYRLNSPSGAGQSAPQYAKPLSGSFHGGPDSSSQSPNPHFSQSQTNSTGNGTTLLPPPPPAAPSNPSTSSNGNPNGPAPPYTGGGPSYAPSGFAIPPAMAANSQAGSFHGSPLGRTGSQSASYADRRSSNPSSPLLAAGARQSSGMPVPYGREPVSPTQRYNNAGSYGHHSTPNPHSMSNSMPPPTFSTAIQQQQQQQQNGGFSVGSFPGQRGMGGGGVGPHSSSSPFSRHMSPHSHPTEAPAISESYGTNTTQTLSTMADDTMSSSGKSGSSASSIRDDLPLCPNDDACTLINDRKHQKKYAHTCRLFPCYHGHVIRHAKLFRHATGQISLPEGISANTKVSSHALASVNFSTISPEAPNAYRIYVSHGDKSYELFGDWASVKVHTFKRYLHQVYHIAPSAQVLSVMKTGKIMDDDINTVKCYGIEEDVVIQLRSDMEDAPGAGRLRIPLDDL